VDAILGDLRLGDPLKEEPRAEAVRILDPAPSTEILFSRPDRPQPRVKPRHVGCRVTQDGSPEGAKGAGVGTVEGDLDSARCHAGDIRRTELVAIAPLS
jgi:hypothetical protein